MLGSPTWKTNRSENRMKEGERWTETYDDFERSTHPDRLFKIRSTSITMLARIRDLPVEDLPPSKRLRRRAVARQVSTMVRNLGVGTSLAIVAIVLRETGFVNKPGGGEPAIPTLISSFLTGWGPMVERLLWDDLLSTKPMRQMARFVCNPLRLLVEPNALIQYQLVSSTSRCSQRNTSCPFRCMVQRGPWWDPAWTTRCSVTSVDSLSRPELRKTLLDCGMLRYRERVPGDTMSMGERIVRTFLEPLVARFKANDDAKSKRERVGLPPPNQWIGLSFQLKTDAAGLRYPTLTVTDVQINAKTGRVSKVELCDNSDRSKRCWSKLRAHQDGWLWFFPSELPFPILPIGWNYYPMYNYTPHRFRIAAFPDVPFMLASSRLRTTL